uniref:Cytochrome c oxidase subunit 3 n=1 Tax=Prosadenoporus spectaculum TaxID=1332185 RepID=X2C8V3_9BILA|nr:cytochrome c oxidase subunit III [Prosadenoporus spectaculum]AGL46780.1 cytochrome c oxidase subunit III [Prosadenoporus spectaculum]
MVRNPFHLVEFSPWPLVGSLGAFFLTVGFASWFHSYGILCCFFGVVLILLTMVQWWRDVVREGTYQGFHTGQVSIGLRWGMLLFITSEVLFFFAFFWAYFHSSLAPTFELGSCWPPVGVDFLNPFSVPLLNTAVLLASGVSVTWAHHSLMEKDRMGGINGLVVTVLLGSYFIFLQAGEYYEASFYLSDSVFGSVFFVATGFHGLHVLIGSTFLFVCLLRVVFFHFSDGHHFGFEAAAWYWHFVDVVWLFLYLCIYWWGS